MEFSKPMPTFMAFDATFSAIIGDNFESPTFYRSITRALQYTSIITFDITFVVNKVCQFMEKPLIPHWHY